MKRLPLVAFLTIALGIVSIPFASASSCNSSMCPFCDASGQTLRQEMESMDVVAIASLVSVGSQEEGTATFRIDELIKGNGFVKVGFQLNAVYLGPPKSASKFLIQGVDPTNFIWSSPIALSKEFHEYVKKLQNLSSDPSERLAFFQDYFEHPDTMLARDAYDEFAQAPYEEVLSLKPVLKRDQLISWVKDPAISPDRKRLYYTLLGICGQKEDAQWMEGLLRSKDPKDRRALDALSASYLMIKGDEGLELVGELFLKNPESEYVDVYAVIGALRFHATEGKKLAVEKIVKTMSLLLDRAELADLVIPDLARLEDWSHLDRLMKLFREARKSEDWMIRTPIINFMRVCPLPEAKNHLEEMEKIDPAAVQRAKNFFPIPARPAEKKSSDLSWNPGALPRPFPVAMGDSYGDSVNQLSLSNRGTRKELRVAYLDAETRLASLANELRVDDTPSKVAKPSILNQIPSVFVVLLSTVTLGLCMWFIGTGGLR